MLSLQDLDCLASMKNSELYPKLLEYILSDKVESIHSFEKFENVISIAELTDHLMNDYSFDVESPFGFFVRKCKIELASMSFEQVAELRMLAKNRKKAGKPAKVYLSEKQKLEKLYCEYKSLLRCKSLLKYSKAYECLIKFTNMYIAVTGQSSLPLISVMFSLFHAKFEEREKCKDFANEAIENSKLFKNDEALNHAKQILQRVDQNDLGSIDFDHIFDSFPHGKL